MKLHKLNSASFPEGLKLTKDDYVIILGDFGILWKNEPDKTERYWLKWLDNKPWTTLFLAGNHENFNRINKLPKVEMFGSEVGKVSDNVYHLKHGNIYTIHGKTFLTIGGAQSIDKMYRIENVSWWPEEMLSYKDLNNVYCNLRKHNFKVDHVLTHTCPNSVYNLMNDDIRKFDDPTMKELQMVLESLKSFKHWHYGHFHQDRKINDKFTVYYQMIREI